MTRAGHPYELKQAATEALFAGEHPRTVALAAGIGQRTAESWHAETEAEKPATTSESAVHAAKKAVADRIAATRALYLDRAADEKAIATTSGFYAVLAVKHLTEVHQLLTGGPTSRFEGSLEGVLRAAVGGGGKTDPDDGGG